VFGWDAMHMDGPSDDAISKLFGAYGEFDSSCIWTCWGSWLCHQTKSCCIAHLPFWTSNSHLLTSRELCPNAGLTTGITPLPAMFHMIQGRHYGHHFYVFHQTHSRGSSSN